MKKMGEASVLELILDSGVLPEIVKAYSEPLAKAYSQIDSITMYGEGNTAKLAEEVTTNGSQLFQSLEQTLGIDLKSIIAGYLGGKLASKKNENEEIKQEVETTPKQDEEKPKE